MDELFDEIRKHASQFAGEVAITSGTRRTGCMRGQVCLEPREPREDDDPINDKSITLMRDMMIYYTKRFRRRNQYTYIIMTYNRTDDSPRKFDSYEDFVNCKDPWVQWIAKYTTISKFLFDLAKQNPNIMINFSYDWEKLVKAQGSPYFSYRSVLTAKEGKDVNVERLAQG